MNVIIVIYCCAKHHPCPAILGIPTSLCACHFPAMSVSYAGRLNKEIPNGVFWKYRCGDSNIIPSMEMQVIKHKHGARYVSWLRIGNMHADEHGLFRKHAWMSMFLACWRSS